MLGHSWILHTKKEQKARREALLKQVSSLRYLLRQGLAIRGHEPSEGILFQQLCSDDSHLKMWLSDQKYISPDILNEQIQLMANTVLRTILKEIQSASSFSIIADEATDVKRCEQMCICIRWVDDFFF